MIKRGSLKLKVISLIFLVLLLNIVFFTIKYGEFREGVTGFSVQETISKSYNNMSLASKIFLVLQWIILLIVFISVVFKEKSQELEQAQSLKIPNNYHLKEQKTDLDVLYDLLKEKKELKLSAIAKAFNIDENIAMEWAKILQTGNLAIIDYPFFGGAIIRIKE